MTQPRIVAPHATIAFTRRTNLRKAMLGDWDPRLGDGILYLLAHAANEHDVSVHYFIRMISHQHLNGTPENEDYPDFLQLFHREESAFVNTLLADRRYDAPRQVFDGEQTHSMRLLDPAAQLGHLVYEHLNPVAAGLVSRPQFMPGTQLHFRLWKEGGIAVKRPDIYVSRDRPSELWLPMGPPPLLYEAYDGDLDAIIEALEDLVEDGIRSLRAERKGRPFVGPERLKRIHPWDEPKTLARRTRDITPSFKVGTTGELRQVLRSRAKKETAAFRRAYRTARNAHRDGQTDHAYPYGTYLAVKRGAPVCEPDPHALLLSPGPSIRDIDERLREQRLSLDAQPQTAGDAERASAQNRVRRRQLHEEVRDAWHAQVDHLADTHHLELDYLAARSRKRMGPHTEHHQGAPNVQAASSTRDEPRSADAQDRARPDPRVLHRNDRRPDLPSEAHPRRLVIRRDARRGRPRSEKSSSDPPR